MSYIEKSIGGKVRGLKFNQGAHIMFLKKIDPENYESTTGYALIYAGLKANAFVKGEEFLYEESEKVNGALIRKPITFEMVCDWVDQMNEQDVLDIVNCYKETQAYKKMIPEPEPEEDDKKKLE